MASNQSIRIRRAVTRYAAGHGALRAATDAYVGLVTQLLDDAGINYLAVTGRTKTVESFAGKAARRTSTGRLAFPKPLTDITDQIGVRVVTYVQADVEAVAQLLDAQLEVRDDRDMGQETAAEGRFGYASRHLLVAVDDERARAAGIPVGRPASVQIRTVLQHAWAEFEHDVRYKGSVPEEHAHDFDRRFTLAAGLLELADQQFTAIRDRHRQELASPADAPDDDPRIGATDLAAFLAGQFADAGWSRTDHYAWISGLLLELGVTSLAELREVLRGVDDAVIDARMGYRYPPGAVRRLDDSLLSVYGERYVALHGNAHRQELLTARLARLHT
ncbi:GTP pyrophosphokinase [uncultured Serinicoccus sp.]|uniref:GTP pyrophosphokinase n=1 Tax=uncultured Serinicoccus sp. TaxID=735514 RepID=UPI002615F621|nr:GTP pyrophosphokinase [uncultured Serinicoccus sp.]